MSVIVSWDDLLSVRRLPAGDVIRLSVYPVPGLSEGHRNSNYVWFRLDTAPWITWYKEIRFFDRIGTFAFIQTQDDAHHAGPVSMPTMRFNLGLIRVELVKAREFGIHRGVYELVNVGRWKGCLLAFEWLEDY
ncbi:MAG: hypothetical protein ICV53_06125 [Flavisolibacter sp.]|nr:hypothetical protein [Flavisolibacter sp.]